MAKEVNKTSIEAATRKAQTLPESTQFAISVALPNIVNGAFWGFTEVENVKPYATALKADKNITLRKIQNGCILEVNPSYICTAMSYIDASVVTQKDVAEMQEGVAKACAVFEKFLVTKSKVGFSGYIGIYCTNDVSSIIYKGNTFPAFRLPLEQVVSYLAKYGYSIVTKNAVYPASTICNANIADVWDSIIMSPTHTGCFLSIRK